MKKNKLTVKAISISGVHEEFAALWEISKRKRLNRTFFDDVKNYVHNQRNGLKSQKADALQAKLALYGNDGKWGKQKLTELSKIVYQQKRPEKIDLGKWVSVEIECIFPDRKAEQELALFTRKHGLSKQVTIKHDGSVRPNESDLPDDDVDPERCETCFSRDSHGRIIRYDDQGLNITCGCYAYGREIVITFKHGDWDFVKTICEKINSLGCYVNKTCGLHVHFDCRHLTARQVSTLGRRLAHCVPALHQMLPPSRKGNQYCRKTINSHKRGDRYTFVNLQSYNKHGTIEVRGHSGTTDWVKICNWIKILRGIMDRRNTKPIETIAALVLHLKPEQELVNYMSERYLKFYKPNGRAWSAGHDDVAEDNVATPQLDMSANAYEIMLQAIRQSVTNTSATATVVRGTQPETEESPELEPMSFESVNF